MLPSLVHPERGHREPWVPETRMSTTMLSSSGCPAGTLRCTAVGCCVDARGTWARHALSGTYS